MATYWENSCSFGLRYVSWYKYLIVSLVFSHLGFWSGNLFLIAPFPDLCLLVPFRILNDSSQKAYEVCHELLFDRWYTSMPFYFFFDCTGTCSWNWVGLIMAQRPIQQFFSVSAIGSSTAGVGIATRIPLSGIRYSQYTCITRSYLE